MSKDILQHVLVAPSYTTSYTNYAPPFLAPVGQPYTGVGLQPQPYYGPQIMPGPPVTGVGLTTKPPVNIIPHPYTGGQGYSPPYPFPLSPVPQPQPQPSRGHTELVLQPRGRVGVVPDLIPDIGYKSKDRSYHNNKGAQLTKDDKKAAKKDIRIAKGLACFTAWCCCFILGIAAFFVAREAEQHLGRRRLTRAKDRSRLSLSLSIFGIAAAVLAVSTILVMHFAYKMI